MSWGRCAIESLPPWMLWTTLGVALWAVPWKAVALWRAAQRRDRAWFIALFLVNTAAILEMLYILKFSKRPSAQPAPRAVP